MELEIEETDMTVFVYVNTSKQVGDHYRLGGNRARRAR
jgi:hypothetical protein